MFGEERLDPHGGGNLPHVLTITNKLKSRLGSRVADRMWEEINITNVCDCRRATKPEHEDDYPLTGIIKDETAKARSLGIKCVPLLDINRR